MVIFTSGNFRLVKLGLNRYSRTVEYVVEQFDRWVGEWLFDTDNQAAGRILSRKEAESLLTRLKNR